MTPDDLVERLRAWIQEVVDDPYADSEGIRASARAVLKETRTCVMKRSSHMGLTLYPTTLPPMGCVCPPTSEQTCLNPMCPRKGIKVNT